MSPFSHGPSRTLGGPVLRTTGKFIAALLTAGTCVLCFPRGSMQLHSFAREGFVPLKLALESTLLVTAPDSTLDGLLLRTKGKFIAALVTAGVSLPSAYGNAGSPRYACSRLSHRLYIAATYSFMSL